MQRLGTSSRDAQGPLGGSPPDGEPYAALVETHTSVVILLGDRALKVKKPVALPFVDLSTPELRRRVCEAEIRLNRRFAPDVYLGLADLRLPAVAGPGEPVVVMRRMPASRRLSTLLSQGRSQDEGLRRQVEAAVAAVARQVAVAHAARPPVRDHHLWRTTTELWAEGLEQLATFSGLLSAQARPSALEEVGELAVEYLAGRRPLLDGREEAGLVREGHGDLLADDVFALDDGPRILDCLEFDERLRLGDVLADVAFLAMDLESLGDPALARRLLDSYREFSAERHPRSLEHHYVAYRAFVRCKVQCLRQAQGDEDAARRAVDLLALCRSRLRRGRIHLVLVGGLPGTGKSTLCEALVRADGDRDWALLSSDVVRKQAAGLSPHHDARAPFREGLYSPERTTATYDVLLERAADTLGAGVNVVLDASWTDPGLRRRAVDLASSLGARVTQVRCTVPREVSLARLTERRRDDEATSDADVDVYEAMAGVEVPWPQALTVTTTGSPDLAARQVLAAIVSSPSTWSSATH